MALRIRLEPQEWLMVGTSRVLNIWNETAKLKIHGAGPVLRQEHTLSEGDADSSAKRVYYAVQTAYLGINSNLDAYFDLVDALLKESPESSDIVQIANDYISKGSFYGALLEYRKLIGPKSR